VGKNRRTDHRLRRNDHDAEAGEIVSISNYALPTGSYPLLSAVLEAKGLSLKGAYRYCDVAEIFDCSIRALQERVRAGQLTVRDLPGRKKFLAQDLENFLRDSVRKPNRRVEDK
jgi:hypothetical protein